MSETKPLSVEDKEKMERTAKFIDLQLDSVQSIIMYVIQRSDLTEAEITAAKKRADDTVNELGDKSKYLGELLISLCFCYDGALRTMLSMIQDKMQPISNMSLDEIATEIFNMTKQSDNQTKH